MKDIRVNNQLIKEYKKHTLNYLREHLPELYELPDKHLETLYSKYSNLHHSAGWVDERYLNLERFYNWATKSPSQMLAENLPI